jgi:ATP-dependent protease ClpP protease subunit
MPKTSVLKLSGEISEASANALVEQIEAVPANQTIKLRIASPGGSIFNGTNIMTALRAHQGGVDTITGARQPAWQAPSSCSARIGPWPREAAL